MSSHGLLGIPDAGAFLARLTRLDPAAPVRLRNTGNRVALWGRLPWEVLVTREVAGHGPDDATVAAGELLAVLARGGDELPPRRDAHWRWPLPPPGGETVESVSGAELSRLAEAAAGTLREVSAGGLSGRSVSRSSRLRPAVARWRCPSDSFRRSPAWVSSVRVTLEAPTPASACRAPGWDFRHHMEWPGYRRSRN